MISGEEAIKIAFSDFDKKVMVGVGGVFSGSQQSETAYEATVAQQPLERGNADASVEYQTPRMSLGMRSRLKSLLSSEWSVFPVTFHISMVDGSAQSLGSSGWRCKSWPGLFPWFDYHFNQNEPCPPLMVRHPSRPCYWMAAADRASGRHRSECRAMGEPRSASATATVIGPAPWPPRRATSTW